MNNRKRVIRAIQIARTHDINKSETIDKQEHKLIVDEEVKFLFLNPDRKALYESINKRVDMMFEQGLVDEVKDLLNKYELFYLGTENQTEFKIHNSGKTIELISISYIVPVKRIHLIIKALAECATHNIKINWTHIGDGSEKQNILALAESLLNDSTVSYNFLGHLENKSIHEHLRNHGYDLFVNMSESEGLPVSMMEAMSYGIPVIGTNVGGVGEIVDSNTGYLLDKDDCCNQFLDVILKWRKMTEPQKQTKRVNAYNKWNVFFNAEKNYTEFAKDLLNTDKKQEKGKEI